MKSRRGRPGPSQSAVNHTGMRDVPLRKSSRVFAPRAGVKLRHAPSFGAVLRNRGLPDQSLQYKSDLSRISALVPNL